MLGLVLTLPGMSTKQPRCLTTMADLLTPASKAYLVIFKLIFKSVYKETHIWKMLQKWNTSCSKDLLHGTADGRLLTNGGRKSEGGLRWFEGKTTATAGCLVDRVVDIPDSLRNNPNNEVQSFWLWTSG